MKAIISFRDPAKRVRIYGLRNVVFVYAVRIISTGLYLAVAAPIAVVYAAFCGAKAALISALDAVLNVVCFVMEGTAYGEWRWDDRLWGRYYKQLAHMAVEAFRQRRAKDKQSQEAQNDH